ncbi:hypothetical protein [Mesobaculum littorinae]|uniref:hypothetical protein n=1 Tax=Mesobaculum littorinae TaxID=2486419 RepID=UPI0013E3EA78|nr:hypothetical protein [Mesobaculum littorinae]
MSDATTARIRAMMLAALTAMVAGCGAPGAPEPVGDPVPRSGVSVSGTASVGIAGSF